MQTITIVDCGLVWTAAIVEFARTIRELERYRRAAGRALQALGPR